MPADNSLLKVTTALWHISRISDPFSALWINTPQKLIFPFLSEISALHEHYFYLSLFACVCLERERERVSFGNIPGEPHSSRCREIAWRWPVEEEDSQSFWRSHWTHTPTQTHTYTHKYTQMFPFSARFSIFWETSLCLTQDDNFNSWKLCISFCCDVKY